MPISDSNDKNINVTSQAKEESAEKFWSLLLENVTSAVHDLEVSIETNQNKDILLQQLLTIIEKIRILVVASNTLEILDFKVNHRQILNSISSLIQCTKVASDLKTLENIGAVQKCCHEVSLANKHFVVAAKEFGANLMNLDLIDFTEKFPKPNFLKNFSDLESLSESDFFDLFNGETLHFDQEFINLLDKSRKSLIRSISLLVKTIRLNKCNSNTLISEVRSLVIDVGNYLASVDEIPISSLLDDISMDFKVNRITLYNNLASLVNATQQATSPLCPINSLEYVILNLGLVERSIKDLFVSTKFLLEEKGTLSNEDNTSISKENLKNKSLADDNDGLELVFGSDLSVKGGTLKGLLNYLLNDSISGSNFESQFLLTYRTFTTSTILYEHLRQFFVENVNTKKLTSELVRVRVLEVLELWVENYSEETEEDTKILNEILHLCQSKFLEHQKVKNAVDKLIQTVEEKKKGRLSKSFSSNSVFFLKFSLNSPPPILPKNLLKISLLDIDPLELARQLTILESHDFISIKPFEFLNKEWSNKNSMEISNIKNAAKTFNMIMRWVAETVLNATEIKLRAAYIKQFILTAERCRTLNNFNTLMSLLAGLNSAPVHRLRRTFDQLSSKTKAILDSIGTLMSTTKNYSAYRETLHHLQNSASSSAGIIPFLGCHLTDLTFIEDGNPQFLKINNNQNHQQNKNKIINFSKRIRTSEVIKLILNCQRRIYNLTPIVEIQNFLKEKLTAGEEADGGGLDETRIYELSLSLEPRERDDEKIARLLAESGFL
ncbi:hypothetical protein HK099_005530 [Clydaea vesicula]|uniref:Ras guanine nucleotide exchange factor n=1 Tax=Clydaea vesicula TaxID=447962 RepID=A0AAD5XUV8_9FUNG|nr:hypothetical protein HK099_005530 [Clydaea vesicula]